MKRFNAVAVFLALVVCAGIMFLSCKDRQSATNEDPGKDIIINVISNPDESLNLLQKNIPSNEWGKYLDARSVTGDGTELERCFNIGVKSANALLAVYKGDYETAKAIAASIKQVGQGLKVNTREIEDAAGQLISGLGEKDEKVKSEKVKFSLNLLKDRTIALLVADNRKSYAVAVEYGLWMESLRHVSALLGDHYNAPASSALNRESEAKYFIEQFTQFKGVQQNAFFQDGIDATSNLLPLMKSANKTISAASVKGINRIASDFQKKHVR